jgi:hypothetical protein
MKDGQAGKSNKRTDKDCLFKDSNNNERIGLFLAAEGKVQSRQSSAKPAEAAERGRLLTLTFLL